MEKRDSASKGADQLVCRKAWRTNSRTTILLGVGIICLSVVGGFFLYGFLPGLLGDLFSMSSVSALDWTLVFIMGLGVVLFLGGIGSYFTALLSYGAEKRRIIKTSREAVVESLVRRVQDKDFGPDQAVITILGDLGDRSATLSLIETLKNANAKVRMKSARSLGNIKDERAGESLLAALKDKVYEVKSEVAKALDKLNWKPSTDLEKAHYFVSKWQWNEVVKLGDVGIDPVIEALRDKDKFVRAAAARTLGKIGDKRALDPLTEALKDVDNDVRSAAKASLNTIKKKERL